MEEQTSKRSLPKFTLCWDCARSIGRCSWSQELKPVKGWDAVPTKRKSSQGNTESSYLVIKCPLFERDAINGGVKKYKENK